MSKPAPPPSPDERFMLQALRLAGRSAGSVEPNPMVGCVIVARGRVLGTGRHLRFGGPHAEVEALRNCADDPRGATAYVTLEPCCYHGKTPPCTDALIRAGVARVVAGTRDPNPRVSGRGLQALRRAGIRVECGVLEIAARDLIAPFEKRTRTGLPWVIAKWAQSADGVIATHRGDSRWISDEPARAHAHRVRGRVDAILVGVGTVLRDDPLLTCRVGHPRRVATRVVLDARLRTPLTAQLVRTSRSVPTLLCCDDRAPRSRPRALAAAGCEILPVRSTSGRLALPDILTHLGERGMTNLLVEGGGRVLGDFFDQRCVDEVHVYIAPRLIGGRTAVHALDGTGAACVADALRIEPAEMKKLGSGWFLCGRVNPASAASGRRVRASRRTARR